MTNSTQMFNTGDYVRTSKGNIGIITRPERWAIVEEDGTPVYTDLDPNRALTDITDNVLKHWLSDEKPRRKVVKLPNLVKLGNKEFEIWSDKLTKLDKLTIERASHTTVLPTEDAKLLIEIYKRNNIWFSIVNS